MYKIRGAGGGTQMMHKQKLRMLYEVITIYT